MTKQKRKLIATFKGQEAQALYNDRAELSGKYLDGVYELYMSLERDKNDKVLFRNIWNNTCW